MIQKVMPSVVSAINNHARGVVISANPTGSALALIIEFVGYFNKIEEEKTKRAQIAAKRDALIHAIQSEATIILNYFAQRFAERRDALDRLFQLLENGLSEMDIKSIDTALAGILAILQDSPLKDLEQFKRAWENPNFIIEL